MRDVTARLNPHRPSGTQRVRSKYIFAFEGYRTEVSYFSGLAENRGIAGINGLVGICVLQREEIDSGCSDPLSMLESLKDNILAMERGRHTVGTMRESVLNEVGMTLGLGRSDEALCRFADRLTERLSGLSDGDGTIDDQDRAVELCRAQMKEFFGRDMVLAIPEPGTYDPEVDRVCVLIDRDRDNHSPQVIDGFVKGCRDAGYEPYICNPCFEFWLMLHFDSVYKVDRRMLEQNPMIGDRRFTEVELDRILKDVNPDYRYDKTELDPLMFMHRIGEAVENSRTFCNDIRCLKHEVGTNLGRLFEDLRRKRDHVEASGHGQSRMYGDES